MKVRIVFIISLAKASPVIPIFTKNPVIPVSGSFIEIAKTTKKTRASKITDFFINNNRLFLFKSFFILSSLFS